MYCDAQQQLSSTDIALRLLSSWPFAFAFAQYWNFYWNIYWNIGSKKKKKNTQKKHCEAVIWVVFFCFFLLLTLSAPFVIVMCRSFPSEVGWSVAFHTKSKCAWVRIKLTEARIKNTLRGFAPYLAAGKPWKLSNSATPIEFLKWFCSKVLCYGRVVGQRAGFAQIGWFHQTKVTFWLGKMGEWRFNRSR